jgi:putative ABC transport system permease protein
MLDFKYALRGLARTPGFTAVTLLTVALAVGANAAIFSIVHQVLLRPLPFQEPDRIVTLWELAEDDGGVPRRWRTTAANYFDWEAQASIRAPGPQPQRFSPSSAAFESMALFGSASANWTGDGEPEELLGARVSVRYFEVLGIAPELGRTFLPEEMVPGRHRVVLLSHRLWQRRFGGSRDVLGRELLLDGMPFEVVGVMPEAVYPTWPQAPGRLPFLPLYQQIFVPMALSDERAQDRTSHVYGTIARLAPGKTLEAARSEMELVARRMGAAYPENLGKSVVVVPYLEEMTGSARPALLVLWGAVSLVLLIACANIAGLLLARSAARQREVELRLALGASRIGILQPFLCESLLLGTAGGILGLGFALAGTRLLIGLSPTAVPRLADSDLGLPVIGFALVLSIGSGMVFGLVPAVQSARADRELRIRAFSPSVGRPGGRARSEPALMKKRVPKRERWGWGPGALMKSRTSKAGARRALVVTEIALAMVLVAGASLLLQSFLRLRRLDPGFRAEGVLVSEVNLPHSKYRDWPSIARFHRALLERLRSAAGVEAAGLTYDHELDSNWIDDFTIEGASESDEAPAAALRIVSPDYFRTMGTSIVRGRPFEELDDAGHPGAALVNEAFVRRYFGGSDPLGRRLAVGTPRGYWDDSLPAAFEIVGVVENVRFLGPANEPEPAFYLPAAQFPVQEMMVAVRVAPQRDPELFAARLREEVRAVDPELPLSNISSMERLLSESVAQPRFNAFVLGSFGTAALVLAALGIYGVLSTMVAQRTSEIGLRMALGARASDVRRMVVGQGMRLAAIGLSLGIVAALALGPALQSLLFGVRASDPGTLFLVGGFLGSIALLASYLPARRASRIEPLTALRHE